MSNAFKNIIAGNGNLDLIPVTRKISDDAIRMSERFGPMYILCRGNGEIWDKDTHDSQVISKNWSWKQEAAGKRWLMRSLQIDPKAFFCFKGKALSLIPDAITPSSTTTPANQVPADKIDLAMDPREGMLDDEQAFLNRGIHEANGKKVLRLAMISKRSSEYTVDQAIAYIYQKLNKGFHEDLKQTILRDAQNLFRLDGEEVVRIKNYFQEECGWMLDTLA